MSIHPLKQARQISPEHWLIAVRYLCIILAVLWIVAAIVMAGAV